MSKNQANSNSQNIIFEDIFQVNALNENGKKFERVNRLHCKGTTFDADMVLGM
jgi:DNA-directed RNA polymerase I, II, and III subunit RPABC3